VISKSTKPYLVRAICEWCADNGYTPYLAVQVDENTRVPAEFVKNGEIVLNIGPDATHRLTLGNELIQFAARFSGVSRECSIPMQAVRGVFARENGEGVFFQQQAEEAGPQRVTTEPEAAPESAPRPAEPAAPAGTNGANGRKTHLQVIK